MLAALLTDLIGTTTCLFFRDEVLHGYAPMRLKRFLREAAEAPAVQELLARLGAAAAIEDAKALAVHLQQRLQEADPRRALPPNLAELQWRVWDYGYGKGHFLSHLYHEVPAHLRRWRADGLRLFAYDQDPVAAQQQLLQYSSHGDLRDLIETHFDAGAGDPEDAATYRHIAAACGLPPAAMLYVGDSPAALLAAQAAGLQVVAMLREDGELEPAAVPAGILTSEDFADLHQILLGHFHDAAKLGD